MNRIGSFILLFSLTITTSCTFKNYDSARTYGYHDDLYRNYQDDSRESVQVSNNLIATPDNYSLGYRDGISDGIGLGTRSIYTNNYFPFYYNWNFGLGYYWDPFLFRYGRNNYFWNFNNPWSFGWSNPWHWNYYSNPWWGYSNFCGPYYRDWRWGYQPIYRQNFLHRQGPRTTFGSSGNLHQYRRSLEGRSRYSSVSSPGRGNFSRRGSSTGTNTGRNLTYSRSTERESRNTSTSRVSREYTPRSSYREAPTTSTPRTSTTTPRSYNPSTPRTYTPRAYTPPYTPSTPRTYTPRTYTPSTPRSYTPRTYTPRTYTPSTPRTYTPSRTTPTYRSRD